MFENTKGLIEYISKNLDLFGDLKDEVKCTLYYAKQEIENSKPIYDKEIKSVCNGCDKCIISKASSIGNIVVARCSRRGPPFVEFNRDYNII